jgi:hypothetical protein
VFGFANANVVVYNNLVYDNLGLGINAGAGGEYYNNTVVNNAAGSMAHGMLPAISRNNILIGGGTYSPVAENWGTSQVLGNATQSDNITSGTASDYFVEASNGDFRLKSSAAQAINQGINLSNVFTTDITRANCDSQFDIGAFEFEASSVSSPPRTNPAPPPSTEFP